MKHKVATLTGALLDSAVAKAEVGDDTPGAGVFYCPSTNWSHGGPIIEKEGLCILCYKEDLWGALHKKHAATLLYGETLLVAAMRAYVHSKFGDSVEL